MKSSIAIAIGCFFAATFAFGETLTVTSNADSGDGTLRALLAASAADDEIVIPANMTITLESVLTLPKWNLTIRGGDKSTSVVSGNGVTKLFELSYGKTVRYEFRDLILEKGFSSDGGAGIKLSSAANATLVMNDCTVRDMSVSPKSGDRCQRGVFMHGGSSSFGCYSTNCVFTGLWGGAAVIAVGANYGYNCTNFVMSNCRLVDNGDVNGHPSYSLLHLSSYCGKLLLDKCVIAGNVSTNFSVIAVDDNVWSDNDGYFFNDCTITNNRCVNSSGLCSFYRGRHVFNNCLISGNSAVHNVIGNYNGNGNGYGTEFRNCIIERNETTATTFDNWSHFGLFFIRINASSKYPEVLLLTNCIVRANIVRENCLWGTYNGGVLRFVDTKIADNTIWNGQIEVNGGLTNFYTRCAIIGNRQDPNATVSKTGLFTGGTYRFDSCLVYSNCFPRTSKLFSSALSIAGTSIVSNDCANKSAALGLGSSSTIVNTLALGTYSSLGVAAGDISSSSPAMTNCYFENSSVALSGVGVVTGKTLADLLIDPELTTNGSKTVFLDGTRMPYLSFAKGSLLRNAGVKHGSLGSKDVRGKSRDYLPDIGCYEYPNPGLNIFVR